MSRPHIEFVQSQHLPWDEGGLPVRAGVAVKRLSHDPDTGALSALLRYPPGWSGDAAVLGVDEEFFVLEGALDHGGVAYGPDCYAYWPAGFERRRVTAPDGAVVLTFFAATPVAGTPAQFMPERLVLRTDIREGEWVADLAAMGLTVMASTARIRRLRSDPVTGEITYVTATIPYWQESQPERHPVVQEIFVLAGETAGPQGVMRPGAYVWRPENKTHGPYGSTTGAVFFFRSHGGPQTTEHDPAAPFRFDPPHRPILPPELAALGEPLAAPARF